MQRRTTVNELEQWGKGCKARHPAIQPTTHAGAGAALATIADCLGWTSRRGDDTEADGDTDDKGNTLGATDPDATLVGGEAVPAIGDCMGVDGCEAREGALSASCSSISDLIITWLGT